MPNPPLHRLYAGAYTLIHQGRRLADVRREHDRTLSHSRKYLVWVVDYAPREGKWRRKQECSTLAEARAWIGGHLEELAKGESV